MSEPTTAEICDCANTGFDAISTCQRVIRGRVEPPCDCECHKPTREQMCADLARAMGYAAIRVAGVPSGFVAWIAPDGNRQFGGYIYESPEQAFAECAPDYFTDHAACHELVVWLAESAPMRQRVLFLNLLLEQVNKCTDEQTIAAMMGGDRDAGVRRDFSLLTADPAIIAEAAWRAIQPIKEK